MNMKKIDFKKVKMRKICCAKWCKNYKKFKKPKMLCICNKALRLFSICDKCGRKDKRIFEEEEIVLKILGLINNM